MEILSKKDISDTYRVCTIKVNSDEMKETYALALEKVQPKIRLKGFRANKVPQDLIKKRFSPAIQEEFRDLLLNKGFDFFAQSEKFLGQPKLNKFNIQEDQTSAEIDFEYVPMPEVPKVDLSAINLTKPIMEEISSDDVSKFISDLLDNLIENYDNNETEIKLEAKSNVDSQANVANQNSDSTLATQEDISDLNLEQIKASKSLSGQERLKALSDAEVKIIFETEVDQVEEKIKDKLKEEFAACSNNFVKIQLFNTLESKIDFKIPDQLVDKDLKSLSHIKDELNAESKVFESKTSEEQDAIIKKYSIRRTKIGLFLDQYSEENQLQVTSKDIILNLQQLQQTNPTYYQYLISDPQNRLSDLRLQILENKAVKHILDLVNFDHTKFNFYDLVSKLEELEHSSFN